MVKLMHKFKYKPPQVKNGDLRTPVTFYEFVPKEGPLPGQTEKRTLFESWAKIDEVWMKDLELAKSNGTLSDVTIRIRDPLEEFRPTNKHYLSIDDPDYKDNRYNIKAVHPDMQDRRFIRIVAGVAK